MQIANYSQTWVDCINCLYTNSERYKGNCLDSFDEFALRLNCVINPSLWLFVTRRNIRRLRSTERPAVTYEDGFFYASRNRNVQTGIEPLRLS